MLRAVAAGLSAVAAAASGVITALVTAHRSLGLWVALGVLIIVGALLQVLVVTREPDHANPVTAVGAGSVAVRGSAGEIHTQVRGLTASEPSPDGAGITALGPGAVGVGGDANGPVSTDVSVVDK